VFDKRFNTISICLYRAWNLQLFYWMSRYDERWFISWVFVMFQ